MIDPAKRLGSIRSQRNQAIFTGLFGRCEKRSEKLRRQTGHIAGHDQVPLGGGGAEGGVKSSQWAHSFSGIRDDRQTEKSISFGRANQGHVPRRLLYIIGRLFNQSSLSKGEESFVAAHAAATSAYEHEPGAKPHAMIVAILSRMISFVNKRVYICFILSQVWLMAASPLRAADLAAPPPNGAARQTFVVRVDPRTGRLVRRELGPPIPKAPRIPPPGLSTLVDQSARAYGVDPLLVQSVIQVESNYDPNAVSPKGAEGLMQLMPGTSRMLGVSNTFDPGQNIEAGVRYLRYLQDLYKDDQLALAAYNAGPATVEKFKSIPPFSETRKYVEKVGRRYGEVKAAAQSQLVEKGAKAIVTMPASQEERYSKLEQFVDENGRLHLQTTP